MDSRSPVIGVLALQGDVAEHLRVLRELGARPAAVRRPGELHGIGGPPSRSVFTGAPWVQIAGQGVEGLATKPGSGRMVAVRQGPALATAFRAEEARHCPSAGRY